MSDHVGSITAINWALNHPAVETAVERLVLVGLADHAGAGGIWPSTERIARYACVSKRHVQRTLRVLENKGLITTLRNEGGNHRTPDDHRPNLYVLNMAIGGDTQVTPRADRGDTQVTPRGDTQVTQRNPMNYPERIDLDKYDQPPEHGEPPEWFAKYGPRRNQADPGF